MDGEGLDVDGLGGSDFEGSSVVRVLFCVGVSVGVVGAEWSLLPFRALCKRK